MKDIESLLRNEAPPTPPPPGLEARIAAAVRATPHLAPSRPRRLLAPPAFAAAAAALAVGVAVTILVLPDRPAPPSAWSGDPPPPPALPVEPADLAVPDLALENPLRSEALALEEGVRRTGRFLIRALPDPGGFD